MSMSHIVALRIITLLAACTWQHASGDLVQDSGAPGLLLGQQKITKGLLSKPLPHGQQFTRVQRSPAVHAHKNLQAGAKAQKMQPKRSARHVARTNSETRLLRSTASNVTSAIAKIQEINETFDAIYSVVDLVNKTANETLQAALDSGDAFLLALSSVSQTAQSMEVVLGADGVEMVQALADSVTKKMTPVIEQLEKYSQSVQALLQQVFAQYDAEKNKIFQQFMDALLLVNASSSAGGKASFLQREQAKGMPGWLRRFFNWISGGGRSKSTGTNTCSNADAAIQQANGTVFELYNMVVKFNTTMCVETLDALMSQVNSSMATVEQAFDAAVSVASTVVPAVMIKRVNETAAKVFKGVSTLQSKVDKVKLEVIDGVAAAQDHAVLLYSVVQVLLDEEKAACKPSKGR
eukprot:CAMPEP_0170584540 /NCGR_PEP_ID=MMETSP0224-20130122/8738_1 /TAXON_ID=285029 /ORGANISM="Togula jolla, Strain CCCM 725" /LENGTH=406 /DNA_ID=CAMNT_0010907971 /DNA_START=80 /DNA_END=1300 /DNA_ORIENTATION=+